ncbi:hypothetical protein EYF80_003207 [Liparis tanakae]|uniref:Uncharacterized protein n=1 Tax=Liparis tanakae TaxID=230148 RepID=A0A4Z2J8T8_9TELE|nr:hypothetical protein EYF80_003207 [Liparis tanakae]
MLTVLNTNTRRIIAPMLRRERQTSQVLETFSNFEGRPADGEAHGDHAIPEAELPGGHVMIQQEKRKHGHCTLLACIQSDRRDRWTKREDREMKRRRETGKEEGGKQQT